MRRPHHTIAVTRGLEHLLRVVNDAMRDGLTEVDEKLIREVCNQERDDTMAALRFLRRLIEWDKTQRGPQG